MTGIWWETRRPGEPTPTYLGRTLDAARRAREGHFDDFFAPREIADDELDKLAAGLREIAGPR